MPLMFGIRRAVGTYVVLTTILFGIHQSYLLFFAFQHPTSILVSRSITLYNRTHLSKYLLLRHRRLSITTFFLIYYYHYYLPDHYPIVIESVTPQRISKKEKRLVVLSTDSALAHLLVARRPLSLRLLRT